MKTTITTVFLLCLSAISLAQNVHIPDANFKAYLLANTNINTNNDNEIQKSEAEGVDILYIPNKKNEDLTGIKSFIKLTHLNCRENSLTSLDVSSLEKLRELRCAFNSLTNLDVSGLTNLTFLDCNNNLLTSLNASGLSKLQNLYCNNNSLTNINVSGLLNLKYFDLYDNKILSINISSVSNLIELNCYNNILTSLDVSNLLNLSIMRCYNNSSLNTICISSTHDTTAKDWRGDLSFNKDISAQWSTTCSPLAFSEIQTAQKPTILKAYNLHGQEVPINTKGEVIIILYDNGLREKTYIAE